MFDALKDQVLTELMNSVPDVKKDEPDKTAMWFSTASAYGRKYGMKKVVQFADTGLFHINSPELTGQYVTAIISQFRAFINHPELF